MASAGWPRRTHAHVRAHKERARVTLKVWFSLEDYFFFEGVGGRSHDTVWFLWFVCVCVCEHVPLLPVHMLLVEEILQEGGKKRKK